MIELENTTFNEAEDGVVLVAPGTYPAHISSFSRNEYNGSTVFNMTYRVADDAKKLTMPKIQRNGEGETVEVSGPNGDVLTISCDFMVGKDYRGQGVWLTPKPKTEERWKNRKYKEFVEGLGLTFPEKKVNGKNVKVLSEIEESDILGLPVYITLVPHSFISNTSGDEVNTMRVGNTYKWEDGAKLDPSELEEEVPF